MLNYCRFCRVRLNGGRCAKCGSISLFGRSDNVNSNAFFTDYSYNRYGGNLKATIYQWWMGLSSYLFITNSLLSRVLNFIFWPLLGGKPAISFSPTESLLDVGCGKGSFLNALPKNWNVHGCDIVNYELDKKLITLGNFELLPVTKRYSIVRSSHSLEHSQNPKKFLEKVIESTKKQGYIILLSPNSSSLSCKIFKKNWFVLKVKSHYCILNDSTVRDYLEKNGCRIIYSNTYTLFSSAGSICAMIKKSDSIVLLLLIAILLLPLTISELLLNKADSFIIYAKKI